MASIKVEKPTEKPVGSQSTGQVKAVKPCGSTPKTKATKQAPKKTEQKSQSKKKASGSK